MGTKTTTPECGRQLLIVVAWFPVDATTADCGAGRLVPLRWCRLLLGAVESCGGGDPKKRPAIRFRASLRFKANSRQWRFRGDLVAFARQPGSSTSTVGW